jgi:hypothetical protein
MSFRQFGGLQFASKHNAVASYYNTSSNLLVTQNVGQSNSYINFLSDISGNINIYGNLDVSGNLNVSGDVDISGNLHVQGNIDCSGNVLATTFSMPSDYRIKENVTQLDETFIVDKLNPVTYLNKKSGKQDIGLIADELQEIYPELVNGEKDGEQLQSVNYTGLIKEIQQLKKEIKSVKTELNELKQIKLI